MDFKLVKKSANITEHPLIDYAFIGGYADPKRIINTERDLLNALMKNNLGIQRGLLANYWVMYSPETILENEIKDDIILITQFYISLNKARQAEILQCLEFNLNNKTIDKVYLITERIYTEEEMKIADNSNKSKIIQINIGRRLKYSDVFDIIEDHKINGYIILANSDIFFDD